jgi:hypothetical protein
METKQKKLTVKLLNIQNRINNKKYKSLQELFILQQKYSIMCEKINDEVSIITKFCDYRNIDLK